MGNAPPSVRGLTHDPSTGGLSTTEGSRKLIWEEVGGLNAICTCMSEGGRGSELEVISEYLQEEEENDNLRGLTIGSTCYWRSQTFKDYEDNNNLAYRWCEVHLQSETSKCIHVCFRLDIDEEGEYVNGFLLPSR